MPFITHNGLKIFYEVHGEGEPIFLLHHGFGCTMMWNDIFQSLVAAGYRTVMLDRRGYGESEPGADFETFFTSDRYRSNSVEELELLRNILDIDSFHIIGQCEGGVVGVDYAVKYPQRVKTLVTSSTMSHCLTNVAEKMKAAFPKLFRGKHPEFQKKFLKWHGEQKAESHYNLFRLGGGAYGTDVFDLREKMTAVPCPTLVIFPDRSSIFEVEQSVTWYRHLPAGELAVLPNCGHNTYEEQPADYIRYVLNFFKRHTSASEQT